MGLFNQGYSTLNEDVQRAKATGDIEELQRKRGKRDDFINTLAGSIGAAGGEIGKNQGILANASTLGFGSTDAREINRKDTILPNILKASTAANLKEQRAKEHTATNKRANLLEDFARRMINKNYQPPTRTVG